MGDGGKPINILIDADGCPVVDLTLQIAKQFSVPVIILCDASHQIEREGAQTLVFDKGADSVDFALVNRVKPGDVVVTQDYGLASSGVELCRFNLSENYANQTALIAGDIIRTPDGWEFRTDGTAARVESLVDVVSAFAE